VDSVYKSEDGILTSGLVLSVIRRFITVLTTDTEWDTSAFGL
jgi:hypothetical protein